MKVSEYIHRKNDIIKKATGLTLVPEDQIIDIEPMKLSMYTDMYACPYCMAFAVCEDCPMELAGNGCDSKGSSTYFKVIDQLNKRIVWSYVKEELSALIDEYNKSNGF